MYYGLPQDDLRAHTLIYPRNLIAELDNAMRARYYPEGMDEPATITRGYRGWPFTASVYHPLFGTIGAADEFALETVLSAMRYLLTTPDADVFVPHAELPPVEAQGDSVAL